MKNMKEGFPPIRNEWAIVLILGGKLGEESLKKRTPRKFTKHFLEKYSELN